MDWYTFMRLLKNACVAKKLKGKELKKRSTTHGLQGTLATILFDHRHLDSSVALRTGHRYLTVLKAISIFAKKPVLCSNFIWLILEVNKMGHQLIVVLQKNQTGA